MTITVEMSENPKMYTRTIPAGSTILGVVQRADGSRGALVRIERTGLLAQVNDGVLRSLPQNATKAALADALLNGGAQALSGRIGGSARTAAKAAAARENGKLGGRPRR